MSPTVLMEFNGRVDPSPGTLIALEGIDGAGTTSQLTPLAEYLTERGHEVIITREPSTGVVGKLLRRCLAGEESCDERTLALLFAADRMHHLHTEIEPALREGKVVITDRYILSNLAYQSVHLNSFWIEDLNAFARRPDLTLFFRVSHQTAKARRLARGGKPELFDADERQIAVLNAYEDAISKHRAMRELAVIRAEAGIDDVSDQIFKAVDKFFDNGRGY